MKSLLIILLGFVVSISFGQTKQANDKIFFESIKESVQIKIKGDGLDISHQISEKKRFNEGLGEDFSTDYIFNRSFTELSNINAVYGIEREKGKSFKKKTTDIKEKSQFSGGVFYDDDKYYQIEFPKVPAGGFTLIEYDLELHDPHFFKRFFFTSEYNCELSEYQIEVDKNVDIGWALFGDQKNEIIYSSEEKGDIVTHSWLLKGAKADRYESNDVGALHHSTHIVPFIKSYTNENGKTQVLNGVKDLFDWYQTLLTRIDPIDESELKKLTLSIVAEEKSEKGKAKAIFNWVQDNIRYVAFESGWRGFIPYPAQEICNKRYGDCKDMTHLMYSMMKYADLKVSHGWVGTRSLPYTYENNATPSVDNHLVINVEILDTTYILDATNSYIPFGIPTSFILSKQILSKNEGSYQLYTVPEFKSEDCIIDDIISIVNIDNLLVGKGSKTYETFEYSRINNGFGNANLEKDKWIEKYLNLRSNKFILKEYEIENKKSRDGGTLTYEFDVSEYVKTFNKSNFINLNLTKPLIDKRIKKDRQNALELNFKKTLNLDVEYLIPEGMKVVELPTEMDENFEVGSIWYSYSVEGNKLIYQRKITVDKLRIEKGNFEEWNKFRESLLKVFNTSVEYK
ncbi:MAG: hypothetical protein ACI857_003121 [Arenicella sp.]